MKTLALDAELTRIVDHNHPSYREKWRSFGKNRFNGAFYYSIEISKLIIPKIETDRNWVLVNQNGCAFDHSIVFIHNNLYIENYSWLANYNDLVLVCGIPSTCEKVSHLGRAVYLPLSVDVEYIEKFSCGKTRDVAFAGREEKRRCYTFSDSVDVLEGMPRPQLLSEMAKYRKVYAVGRTALEAKVLGCEVLPYDPRFPDPSVWKVVDSLEAAKMLQGLLDDIDGRRS